ncbi:hypothetical protein ZONE111904_14005 [Zobellia nedashkovskayae]
MFNIDTLQIYSLIIYDYGNFEADAIIFVSCMVL